MPSPLAKIAIVSNTAWDIYRLRLDLAKRLLEEGYRVLTFASPDEYIDQIEATGCNFINLKHLNRRGTNPLKDARLMDELRRFYERERVQLALHFTIKPIIYGTMASNITGTRSICHVTGLGQAFQSSGLISEVAKRLYRHALKKADLVFFYNREDQAFFHDKSLVPEECSHFLPGLGVNSDYFSPRYNELPSDNTVRFLYTGALTSQKGIPELMKTMDIISSRHPEVQLEIIGSIEEDSTDTIDSDTFLHWLSASPNVVYHGLDGAARSHLAKADAVVCTSHREGIATSLLEGLSMAKPLVAYKVPGCQELIVEGKNGYLAEKGDVKGLVAAMEKLIAAGSARRAEMGEYGRHMVLDIYDQKQLFPKHLDAIKRILSR